MDARGSAGELEVEGDVPGGLLAVAVGEAPYAPRVAGLLEYGGLDVAAVPGQPLGLSVAADLDDVAPGARRNQMRMVSSLR